MKHHCDVMFSTHNKTIHHSSTSSAYAFAHLHMNKTINTAMQTGNALLHIQNMALSQNNSLKMLYIK